MKKPQAPSDLWEQMDAAVGVEHRVQMEGISILEYAERHEISPYTARKRLEEAVKQGRIIQGWRKENTNWAKVYRPK
jgi:hypothetical protein